MLSFALAWFALLPAGSLPPHAPMFPAVMPHEFRLRALDPWMNDLIDDAERRSATFASIIDRLNETDLIVHVQLARTLPRSLRGHVAFASAAESVRYVRVELKAEQSRRDMVASLAHELQHAVEIGQATSVRSESDLSALYRRIGDERDWLRFETNEAAAVGQRVWIELEEQN